MFTFIRRSFRYVIIVFITALWKLAVFWNFVRGLVPRNLEIIEPAVQQELHQQAVEQTTFHDAQQ